MFEISVNNRNVEAEPGETILSALTRAGIEVPTLCHMKKLTPTGACRICVVELEGMAGLVPSCSTPVEAGMRIFTNSPRVIEARKLIIELLLADHPDDCLYCVRSGSCRLQKLAQDYGVRERIFPPRRRENTLDTASPAIVFDQSKCILCGKCGRSSEQCDKSLYFLHKRVFIIFMTIIVYIPQQAPVSAQLPWNPTPVRFLR